MTIETRGCEKCSRPFLAEQEGHEVECAVCDAASICRNTQIDVPGEQYLKKAKLQELADIKIALCELVDIFDKWRP